MFKINDVSTSLLSHLTVSVKDHLISTNDQVTCLYWPGYSISATAVTRQCLLQWIDAVSTRETACPQGLNRFTGSHQGNNVAPDVAQAPANP